MWFLIGILALLISLYQAFVLGDGHYYTLFSIGATLILGSWYIRLEELPKTKVIILYSIILLVASIAMDYLGMALGYWWYPHYTTLLDDVLKYLFEWAMAMTYIFLGYLITEHYLRRHLPESSNKALVVLLAVLISGLVMGLVTESVNVFVYSWQVLSMPLSNAMIGPFFIVFQTIGYCSMVLVTLLILRFSRLVFE